MHYCLLSVFLSSSFFPVSPFIMFAFVPTSAPKFTRAFTLRPSRSNYARRRPRDSWGIAAPSLSTADKKHTQLQGFAMCSSRSAEGGRKGSGDVTGRLVTYCVNQGIDRDVAVRVLDLAERTVRDWTISASEFLTPPESVALEKTVKSLPDICVVPWGGYDEAERRALFVAHADTVPDADALKSMANERLKLLKIQGNFEFEKVSHRDFMGAVLNAGISRQKIGDIVVQGQSGAHVIVHKEIAAFLQTSVTSVRNVKVNVDVTSADELELPPKRIKEIQSVELSMRMDAVVSAGLKISRSKLADMARSGLVYVNYKEMKSPAKNVKTGDVVSVRGVGKLEIGECNTTSKGRYRIMMKKYV